MTDVRPTNGEASPYGYTVSRQAGGWMWCAYDAEDGRRSWGVAETRAHAAACIIQAHAARAVSQGRGRR